MAVPSNPSFGIEMLLYTLSIGGIIGLICSFIVLSSIISKYKLCKCSQSKFIPNFTSILVIIYILSQLSCCVKQIIQIRVYFNSLDNETDYKNNTSTQYNTINMLSSVQLIFWHSANCILYILLSYRLWQLYRQNCSTYCLHTILISLILINILLYMTISILFPKHSDILYHQLLLTGYCIDIMICIILGTLFNKYIVLEIISESEAPYKSTLTSVLLNNSARPSVTTLLSLPTTQSSQGTTNNASDSLTTLNTSSHHTSAASTAEATIEYKLPPLSLGANNSTMGGRRNTNEHVKDWNIIVVKHTVLTSIMVISTLLTIAMFISVYYIRKILNEEDKFILYGIWFLLVQIDSCIKSVGMYLNINMTNNDKEYRKCCSKCDKCCRRWCVECATGQTQRKYNHNDGISNDNNKLQMVPSRCNKSNDLYGTQERPL